MRQHPQKKKLTKTISSPVPEVNVTSPDERAHLADNDVKQTVEECPDCSSGDSYQDHLHSLVEDYQQEIIRVRRELKQEREARVGLQKEVEFYRLEYFNYKLSHEIDRSEISRLKAQLQYEREKHSPKEKQTNCELHNQDLTGQMSRKIPQKTFKKPNSGFPKHDQYGQRFTREKVPQKTFKKLNSGFPKHDQSGQKSTRGKVPQKLVNTTDNKKKTRLSVKSQMPPQTPKPLITNNKRPYTGKSRSREVDLSQEVKVHNKPGPSSKQTTAMASGQNEKPLNRRLPQISPLVKSDCPLEWSQLSSNRRGVKLPKLTISQVITRINDGFV